LVVLLVDNGEKQGVFAPTSSASQLSGGLWLADD
jgi:hypothetical protein